MKVLRRFWFTFVDLPPLAPLNLGCGVTAFDYADSLEILRLTVFKGLSMPSIWCVIEDIDIQTLDSDHVTPNIGLVTARGIWFPLGY